MQNKKKKPAKKMKIVKKPFLRGTPMDKDTAKDSLKFFGSMVIMMIAFLLLSSMMMWDSLFLRILTNGLVLLLAWSLFYFNGLSKGAGAVNSGEIMYQRREDGKAVNDGDLRGCFHPAKGFVTGLLGSIPCLLCALVLAVIAQQQLYGIGALPSWLESYQRRSEIGNALGYYTVTSGLGLEDTLRVIVRMMIMPVVSMVGTADSANLLLLERLSPLIVLLPGVVYGLGYTRGVDARTQVHSSIAAANRKKARSEKKKQQQRRPKQPEQLN